MAKIKTPSYILKDAIDIPDILPSKFHIFIRFYTYPLVLQVHYIYCQLYPYAVFLLPNAHAEIFTFACGLPINCPASKTELNFFI
jgi:hypothetical protein